MSDIAIRFMDFLGSCAVGMKTSFSHFLAMGDGKYIQYVALALIFGVITALIIYIANKLKV